MHFGLLSEHYQPRCFDFSCSVSVLLIRNCIELHCWATWALVYKMSNLVALMNFFPPIFSLQLLLVGLFCSVSQLNYSAFFQAHIKFPIDYPYSPPTFRFLTKMWHPNIYEVRCFLSNVFLGCVRERPASLNSVHVWVTFRGQSRLWTVSSWIKIELHSRSRRGMILYRGNWVNITQFRRVVFEG